MNRLGCKDIGLRCDFEVHAESPEHLVPRLDDHTVSHHGLEFKETEMSHRVGEWVRRERGESA